MLHRFHAVKAGCVAAAAALAFVGLSDPRVKAQEPPPAAEEFLPELTRDGIAWGRRVIKHAIALTRGRQVRKPPFVHPEVAGPIASVALLNKRAAKRGTTVTSLEELPEFLAVREFIGSQSQQPTDHEFDTERTLREALNQQALEFPPMSLMEPREASRVARGEEPPEFSERTVLNATEVAALLDSKAELSERRFWDGQVLDPPVERDPSQVVRVYFVNGINTPPLAAWEEAGRLSKEFGVAVDNIYNATGTAAADVPEALLLKLGLLTGPAIDQTANQILTNAAAGTPSMMVCYSEGMQICQRGVRRALLLTEGQPEVQARIKKQTGFLTVGGWGEDKGWPAGTLFTPNFVNRGDPVPGLKVYPLMIPTVLNLRKFVTIDAHSLLRYISACAAGTPDCPCQESDQCDEVKEAFESMFAELQRRAGATVTTTTTTTSTTTTLCNDITGTWSGTMSQDGGATVPATASFIQTDEVSFDGSMTYLVCRLELWPCITDADCPNVEAGCGYGSSGGVVVGARNDCGNVAFMGPFFYRFEGTLTSNCLSGTWRLASPLVATGTWNMCR